MQHLVYLHGFLSSPQSSKAQQTIDFFRRHYPSINLHVPQLPGDIDNAVAIIDALVNTLPKGQFAFIGSSMGGFLSTYFAERHQCKAVLINPAVEPFNLLKDYMGRHVNPYTGEVFYITSSNIQHLHNYFIENLSQASNYFVLLQTGDETLDYRLAETKYQNSTLDIQLGGDHSYVEYDKRLPEIIAFLR